jgi:hypothetical protein
MIRCMLLILALSVQAAGAESPNPSFYLVNHGERRIIAAYASPADALNWGRDQLGDDILAPGGYAAIRLLANGRCTYDLRVVFAGGRSEERRGFDVCAVDKVVFGGGFDRPGREATDPSFHLINRGRSELQSAYARVAGRGDWGEDRLGDDTVDAGEATDIHLPNGDCVWDLRFVFTDRRPIERKRVNLCQIRDLSIP